MAAWREAAVAATDGKGRTGRRLGLMAAGLGALSASQAMGEDTLDLKFLHYQEEDGRTQVNNPAFYFTHDFGEKGQLGLLVAYDSITGASPTGEAPTLDGTTSASGGTDSIPTAMYSDTRQAATLSYQKRLGAHLPSVALSYSHESDYRSNGLSLIDSWDLFAGRSTLHFGVGTTQDLINPVNMTEQFDKESLSFSAGWTQVLGPRDLLDVSFGLDQLSGYLTDPYKLVTINGAAVAEVRPDARDRKSALLKYGHYFLSRGAIKTSYRYYWDDWAVKAHTLDVSFDQHIGSRWIVSPRLRYYEQGSASFFSYEFEAPQEFMSSDYRLSSFWSWQAGLGATVQLNDAVSLNMAVTYLEQTGIDRVRPTMAPVTPLLGPRVLALAEEEEDDDEGEEDATPGEVSAADLITWTGTLGLLIRF